METCGPPQIQNTMMNQTKYPGESAYFRCQVITLCNKVTNSIKHYCFTLKYSFSWSALTIFFYFFIYLLTYFIKWWFKRSILLEKMRYICIQPSLPLSACFACWFQMIPSHEKIVKSSITRHIAKKPVIPWLFSNFQYLQIDMSKCMVAFIDWYHLRINASEREKIKVSL